MSVTVSGPTLMEPTQPRSRSPRWLVLAPYLLVVLGWAGLTVGNRWYVNPDGVVYAALAERVGRGDLAAAVTGYWSPLLPVLASPLTALGVGGIAAIRVVLLLAALAVVPVLRDLCLRVCDDDRVADTAVLAAVPLLVAAAVFGFYPDLLLSVLLLLFCRAVLTGDGLRPALLAGLWGGLAYLTKPVALPFVVGFVLIVVVVRALAGSRVLGAGLLTLAITAAVASPWIATISVQAGYPTISTAGAFNARMVAPGAVGNPLSYPGLYPPQDPEAVTPWEEPSELPVDRTAATVGKPVTLYDRAKNAYEQGRVVVGAVLRRWLPVLLLALPGLLLAYRAGGQRRRVVLGTALGSAMFAAGMALIVVVERYLWFPQLALLPAAAVALQAIATRWAGYRRFLAAGAAALVLLATAAMAPVALDHWNTDREVWALADSLDRTDPLTGPVAGTGDWERSQLLAYLSGQDYVGLTGPLDGAEDPDAVAGRLRTAGVAHLVVWPGRSYSNPGPGQPPVTVPTVLDVTPGGLVPHG